MVLELPSLWAMAFNRQGAEICSAVPMMGPLLMDDILPGQRNPTQFSLASLWSVESASPLVDSKLPSFRVHLVREGKELTNRAEMDGPEAVSATFIEYLQHADREHFVVMMLCTQNRIIGLSTVSIGTLNAALVSPREVFKAAILANAASVILAHNHPSGDPQPSPEDVQVTNTLRKAGHILEIPVLDHIIVGDSGRFSSLKRMGFFASNP